MDICYSTGKARITPDGIKFLDLYYSSSRAISERWYEQAILVEKEIEIAYTPNDLSKILILPIDPNDEFDVAEVLVPDQVSGSKLEKYFQSIQYLKTLRKVKRKMGIR